MRAIFGFLSLMIVLVVVGVLAKKQLTALPAGSVSVPVPNSADPSLTAPATAPGASPQAQSLQLQQQIRDSMEKAMQQARPMPDEQ
jgi:multidrug efflux pump subunit AcrB